MEYACSGDISPATEGLSMVETALQKMDSLHDRVIKKAKTVKEEEKKG